MGVSVRPETLIRVSGVTKSYGPFQALRGVSIDIMQGDFVALLGPSGCGKTTLLRLIAGLADPTEGEITIDGRRMNGVPPNRRPVNTVFQNYALFPHLTVAGNVAFGPRRARMKPAAIKTAVADALDLVGMSGYGERYPGELSGGQQQRIALARAVVNRPRVLLLDEPLGALDLQLRRRMQLELKHLHARLGITFIFVTHDQEEALVMANRIAVMSEGRIMQVGTGEEIYRGPANRFVAAFIGDANLLRTESTPAGLRIAGSDAVIGGAGAGEKVLMIRPEDIAAGPAPDATCIAADVIVRERVLLGGISRIHADLGAQTLVFQPAQAGADFEPGTRLTVHWRADRARILDA